MLEKYIDKLETIKPVEKNLTYMYKGPVFTMLISLAEEFIDNMKSDNITKDDVYKYLEPYIDEIWNHLSNNNQNWVFFEDDNNIIHFSSNKEHFVNVIREYISYLI